jgi:hypothetical protein
MVGLLKIRQVDNYEKISIQSPSCSSFVYCSIVYCPLSYSNLRQGTLGNCQIDLDGANGC